MQLLPSIQQRFADKFSPFNRCSLFTVNARSHHNARKIARMRCGFVVGVSTMPLLRLPFSHLPALPQSFYWNVWLSAYKTYGHADPRNETVVDSVRCFFSSSSFLLCNFLAATVNALPILPPPRPPSLCGPRSAHSSAQYSKHIALTELNNFPNLTNGWNKGLSAEVEPLIASAAGNITIRHPTIPPVNKYKLNYIVFSCCKVENKWMNEHEWKQNASEGKKNKEKEREMEREVDGVAARCSTVDTGKNFSCTKN